MCYKENNNILYYILRAGSFAYSFSDNSVAFRAIGKTDVTSTDRGFRPALYIK